MYTISSETLLSKNKKGLWQWISKSTAKCISTFPSSPQVTSAAPQTAGRRLHLQQPYSSVTPLKSGPPETWIKQEAEVTCNHKNDKSEMANLSLIKAMTFKSAGAMRSVKMIFFKVLSKLFNSQHAPIYTGLGAEKPFPPEPSAVNTSIQALLSQYN